MNRYWNSGTLLRVVFAITISGVDFAQAQPEAGIASYVASVKENKAVDAKTLSEYSPGGRFSATAITVRALLRLAYRVQDYQLVGAPDWISSKRYDIAAKVDDTPAPQQPVLLRAILKDRFKLAVRNETRQMPRFALVVARSDGRLGPQLIKSDFDCAAYRASAHPLPEPGKVSPCGMNSRMGVLSGKAIPMAQLASSLAFFVRGMTVDKTGLAGGFDVELTWAPEGTPDADSQAPSLFTAVQEQLGLKIVSEKGPVEVLVVDWVEEPSGN